MTRAPLLHAMFHRQVAGDESLLRLAQERFHAADLGPEFYPENPAALVHTMSFHPGQSSGTSTVHLPRHLNLFDPRSLDEIIAFARSCGPGVRGMIVHDQPDVAGRFEDYVRQVRVLNERLEEAGPDRSSSSSTLWGWRCPGSSSCSRWCVIASGLVPASTSAISPSANVSGLFPSPTLASTPAA